MTTIRVKENEPFDVALRRREFYEKPSEIKRRNKQRAERRNRRIRLHGV